jgi:methionine synthase II (cobalamin-independent)
MIVLTAKPDFCSEAMLEGWAADKGNDKTADEMFDAYVKFYNKCFERPEDMHVGIHLCRGNYVGSRHFSEGAYDNIAKKLFQVCAFFSFISY